VNPQIKLACASGTPDLNPRLIGRMREIYPELPLYVVSEFPPAAGLPWIPYRPNRGLRENYALCREALRDKRIRLAAVMLVPNVPYRRLRLLALLLSPRGFMAFNENLDHFMLRPRSVPAMLRNCAWRARNVARWSVKAARDADWAALPWYAASRFAAFFRTNHAAAAPEPGGHCQPGISVVIPSRNGRALLEAQLPSLWRELAGVSSQIVVVDNGSSDGTEGWLRAAWPQVEIAISAKPLSFARAVNRGIARARHSHVCLLNNDMLADPGFFASLAKPFEAVPDLFCATAQIRFPPGLRREETGKTALTLASPGDFPIRSEEPIAGEDGSYVLYGSGGCSLYDARKLRALGGMDEVFSPAYVEDLDLGYRAWQRGWPSVYAAGAGVEHRHRATTSRHYSAAEMEEMLERNYLKFLARSVADPKLFRTLWKSAVARLRLRARTNSAARRALREASAIALSGRVAAPVGPQTEEAFLALTGGAVAVFPGRPATGKPRVLIASPYLPFPLSHGGAVRMYNLMRRAAADFDQVLVAFVERAAPPPPEILDLCAEVVLVRREGSHSLPFGRRPDTVEEFDSQAFHAALRETIRKWRPALAQLEFTQMAQYAADCPVPTILVEHDITFDLYEQLLRTDGGREPRRQLALWRRFETAAWRDVSRVVVMSEKDRGLTAGARVSVLPNGVDLERFRPSGRNPEPRRLLFIGSFAHLPNLLALDFFLAHVWPRLKAATLHVIAGARHEYFLERYRERVKLNLARPGIEVEGFVSDVRPAYERAAVVVAPLVASAGTNIKILEAMAMAKAVVSTPAGVNGLDLAADRDFLLAGSASEMAEAIESLFADAGKRQRIETAARLRAERDFDWRAIAQRQAILYRQVMRE
jgi:GT2 family glycosyltransferase/glycosyltransferase involved in cell wall biosynthesis